jgi:antitoxin HicB
LVDVVDFLLFLLKINWNFMEKHKLYRVVITKDEESGYFVAEVPTLSPCITYGDTIEEAMEMVKEAIEAVVESRQENGYAVPDDNEELEKRHSSIETVMPYLQSSKYQMATA